MLTTVVATLLAVVLGAIAKLAVPPFWAGAPFVVGLAMLLQGGLIGVVASRLDTPALARVALLVAALAVVLEFNRAAPLGWQRDEAEQQLGRDAAARARLLEQTRHGSGDEREAARRRDQLLASDTARLQRALRRDDLALHLSEDAPVRAQLLHLLLVGGSACAAFVLRRRLSTG